tara:strand:- start:3795 stop:4175 length:381 start_codon:yes stop_codon:yes gene_type:complete
MEPRSSNLMARQGLRAYPIATCLGTSLVGLVCWIASSPTSVNAADRGRAQDAGWSVFRAPEPIHLGTPDPGERSDVWATTDPARVGPGSPDEATRADLVDGPAGGTDDGLDSGTLEQPAGIGIAGE